MKVTSELLLPISLPRPRLIACLMKTQQMLVRSAVTVVATGLSLLSSGTSQAHGSRGNLGVGAGSHRGSINNGAIHQVIMSHAFARGRGSDDGTGHNRNDNRGLNRGRGNDDGIRHDAREDRAGRGERERGDDRGGRGERRHRNDDGIRHDLRDDNGGRGERERGDDRGDGRHHQAGDDRGVR